MNRYFSLLALAARHTIYKVLVITAAAAALVGFLMVRLPLIGNQIGVTGDGQPILQPYTLEQIPSRSLAPLACLAGFLAILAVLSLNGCGFGVKSDYTMRRLRLEESRQSLLWAAYYTVCVLFYWAVMAAVCYWAMGRRVALLAADPTYGYIAGPQSRLLAFYSSPFLHHLLPLQDLAVWAEDVFLAVLCGTTAMLFSRRQRKGHLTILPLSMAAMTASSFFGGMGELMNYVVLFVSIGCLIGLILLKGAEEDESPVPEAS